MRPILEVSNLAKKYRINHQPGGYLSLRERLLDGIRLKGNHYEDFWAVDHISFKVEAGESVGIIGRNGAGKSTLLKLLSKITRPTEGRIIARGRIASLLEVGTGFHPELTGRENVFLNGSLLGMKRIEILARFDEIVDFSGTEKFLDTPLKHYSSGMQLRLAFSVAAFLEPEILIIDEVLAVGDAEFQKKCLGKMEDVSKSGRTVLFVSHNMQAVLGLCKTGMYLQDGRIAMLDAVGKTIDKYLGENEVSGAVEDILSGYVPKADADFKLMNIKLSQGNTRVFKNLVNGKDIRIDVHYELHNKLSQFRVFLDVCDYLGTVVFRTFHDEESENSVRMEPGKYISSITIPANLLAPITYDFKLLFGIHGLRMMEPKDGITFRVNVEQTGLYNMAYNGQYTAGVICPVLKWEIRKIE